jgi:hypothetical protein
MLRTAYLVPAAAMETPQQQVATPQPIETSRGLDFEIKGGLLQKLRALEAEIQRLIASQHIPDDQKLGLISNLQTKLLNFQSQFRGSNAGVSLPVVASTGSTTPAPPLPPAPGDVDTSPHESDAADAASETDGLLARAPKSKRTSKRAVVGGIDSLDPSPRSLKLPTVISPWLKLRNTRDPVTPASSPRVADAPLIGATAAPADARAAGAIARTPRAPKSKHKRTRPEFDISTLVEPSPRRLRPTTVNPWIKLRNTREE